MIASRNFKRDPVVACQPYVLILLWIRLKRPVLFSFLPVFFFLLLIPFIYSPILSYSQELKELFLLPHASESCVRVHPLLYYRPRLTNHGNGMEMRTSCAAKTGTPCEKFPQILPSSSSFAAKDPHPGRCRHPYTILGTADFRQCNGEWRSCHATPGWARGNDILNTWLPASKS